MTWPTEYASPALPTTPIYQKYLKMIHEQLGAIPWDGFDLYPEFELLPDSKIDETSNFLKKAHHFCAGFDYALINERIKPEPKYDPSLCSFSSSNSSLVILPKNGANRKATNGMWKAYDHD